MTDEQIVYAMRCLQGETIYCKECPYHGKFRCIRKAGKDALDLINRHAKSRGFTLTSFVRMAVYEYMRKER